MYGLARHPFESRSGRKDDFDEQCRPRYSAQVTGSQARRADRRHFQDLIGVTEQTLYRWRKEYGGMRVDQARRLKDLEAENTRLKKLVADLSLDKMILAEASKVRF
jgi:hypothetical protein